MLKKTENEFIIVERIKKTTLDKISSMEISIFFYWIEELLQIPEEEYDDEFIVFL